MPEVRRRRRSRRWRRLRRTMRQRPVLAVLAGAGLVLFLGLAWVGWLLLSTSSDLNRGADRAEVMRAALLRGDAAGARRALEDFQDAVESAEDKTSGVTWSVFEAMPVLGDDAEGVALAASVLADIGREGLPPVADAADQVSADAFQPRRHTFPLKKIAAMAEPAAQSEAAFDDAARRLAGVDSGRFVGPVHNQFDKLRTLVTDARDVLGSTYRASRLIPRMLGEERPRHFLLVMQNNAEMRSSGGLPGALSLVRAQDGRVDIVEQTDMSDVGEVTADFDPQLTAEERRLFGEVFGDAAVNATVTPDFPRAAQLIRARWERGMGGRLDGMIFVDPVAVSYLLAGTGPVPVPGYGPVHEGNVVRAVENEIYVRTTVREEHSDFQQAVAKAVFDTFADGRGDTAESIRGLARGVTEGRIRMQMFDEQDRAEIAGTKIAGEFPAEAGTEPHVGIYLNDAGPTKMQYYLEYDASLFARSCEGDVQELAGSIDLFNAVPSGPDLPPAGVTGANFRGSQVEPGQQLLVGYLTSPVGGEILSLAIDGQTLPRPVVQGFAGRSVATLGIRLDPGERQRIDFEIRAGRGQVGDAELEVTPGAFPGSSNATVRSACDIR